MSRKKIDLLIFAKTTEKYAAERIAAEAEEMNLSYRVIRYREMSLKMGPDGVAFYHRGQLIPQAKMALFRVAGRGGAGEYFVSQRTALLEHWRNEKMSILNAKGYLTFPRLNKLYQHCLFAKNHLPFVSSWNYGHVDLIEGVKFTPPG